MKACVYPGYGHPPPPARGKTDTTRAALFMLFDAISSLRPYLLHSAGFYIHVMVPLYFIFIMNL